MELKQAITSRRSIRSFTPDITVSRETVETLLRAAQLAPSWKNSQTGRYYVVLSEEKRREVLSTCLPEYNQRNAAGAAALIVTAFERGCSGFGADGMPANELGDGWGAYDLGLQNENLLLAAREMGLDTLIMGLRDAERLRAILSIPDTQEVVSVIALGVRAAEPQMPKRKEIDGIASFF